MALLETFLCPSRVSLKICGVTTRDDALRLVDLGVVAMGVNFWPHSKRYVPAENAGWLQDLAGKILRVGVFVNQAPQQVVGMVRGGLLDVVQLHGEETPEEVAQYRRQGIGVIKAIGVRADQDLVRALAYPAAAVLLDSYAPVAHGGTGVTCDWQLAATFRAGHPDVPLVLAGGIHPGNAAQAVAAVHPVALDVASGAEHAPGRKDIAKVAALVAALSEPC